MPALWTTASNAPLSFARRASSVVCAIEARSPASAADAPGTPASASRVRASPRACRTTSWPAPTRSLAASRPSPAAEPVIKILDNSDQHRAAVDRDDGAGAVAVPHQVEEGLGDIVGFACPAGRECLGE